MSEEGATPCVDNRLPALVWRESFIIDVANTNLAAQSEKLNNLRTNAGVLLGAISVGVTVLAQVMADEVIEWTGNLALGCLIIAILALLLILWPRKWGSGLDVATIIEHHRSPQYSDAEVVDSLLKSFVRQIKDNEEAIGKLHKLYRIGIVLLFVGMVLLVWQGLCWSNGTKGGTAMSAKDGSGNPTSKAPESKPAATPAPKAPPVSKLPDASSFTTNSGGKPKK